MTRSIKEAEQFLFDASQNGAAFPEGRCQEMCHDAYEIESDGTPSATAAWFKATDRHPSTDPRATPRGAFNHWVGGSEDDGHVTISRFEGADDFSTDADWVGGLGVGHWNIVKDPRSISEHWTLDHFVGYSWDIDGHSVKPPHVVTPRHYTHIRAAVAATKIALGKRKNTTPRRHHLATALSELLRALAGK